MFSLGMTEIILVGLIALIFLGPEQIPEVAKTLAKLINEWKRATSSLTDSLQNTIHEDVMKPIEEKRSEQKEPAPSPKTPAAEKIKQEEPTRHEP